MLCFSHIHISRHPSTHFILPAKLSSIFQKVIRVGALHHNVGRPGPFGQNKQTCRYDLAFNPSCNILTGQGRINRHRTYTPSETDDKATALNSPHSPRTAAPSSRNHTASWRSPRIAPYSRGRGQAGRPVANPHRNRSLVLQNNTRSLTSATDLPPDSAQMLQDAVHPKTPNNGEPSHTAKGWVMKRDRHMQLINSSIYDKETQNRQKAIEETRKLQAATKDQREKQKIDRHLKTLAFDKNGQSASVPLIHEILVNGLRFHVLDGGSKLVRIRGENIGESGRVKSHSRPTGPTDSTSVTPKQASIGGVTFVRSKHGNLYRSGVVKIKR